VFVIVFPELANPLTRVDAPGFSTPERDSCSALCAKAPTATNACPAELAFVSALTAPMAPPTAEATFKALLIPDINELPDFLTTPAPVSTALAVSPAAADVAVAANTALVVPEPNDGVAAGIAGTDATVATAGGVGLVASA
jgi:hypothetical protein